MTNFRNGLNILFRMVLSSVWIGSAAQAAGLSLEDQQSLEKDFIRPLVWGGFEARDGLYEAATTYLGEPELKPDEVAWIQAAVERVWQEKKTAEASWPAETDWDRLATVFSSLEGQGILALHNAGATQSDAMSDAAQMRDEQGGLQSKLSGYIFYHEQDVMRVVEDGELYIGFGVFEGSSLTTMQLVSKVVDALSKAGFNVVAPSNADTRILLKGIDWKKRSPDSTARPFRGGSYGELIELDPIPNRVVVCMPVLSLWLQTQEQRLGRPLSEDEFETLRDLCPAIEMDQADAEELLKGEVLPSEMTFEIWQSMRLGK